LSHVPATEQCYQRPSDMVTVSLATNNQWCLKLVFQWCCDIAQTGSSRAHDAIFTLTVILLYTQHTKLIQLMQRTYILASHSCMELLTFLDLIDRGWE